MTTDPRPATELVDRADPGAAPAELVDRADPGTPAELVDRADPGPPAESADSVDSNRVDGADRGSATLWLLVVGLVLVIFSLGGAAIGAARVARHQARVAADLGALAGAARAIEGPDSACARATVIAAANSARITSCTLDGFDLQITTEVMVEPLPGMTRNARATSRAGPVRG